MRETRTYTDEQREQALALIQAGSSQRQVAAELQVPLSTVNEWHVRALEAIGVSDSKRSDYAELWAGAGRLAAVLVADQVAMALESGERLPARDVQAYAIAGGISVDKALDLKDGRKGTSISVDARSLTLPPGLTAEELRAIAFQPPPALEEPHNNVK